MVRRLPVIQNKASEDEEAEQRPRSQWVAVMSGFVLTLWLPLVVVAQALGRYTATLSSSRAVVTIAMVAPPLVSFGLAAFAAGGLVGRFGGRAGVREATMGGLVAAWVACAIALVGGALRPWPVLVASVLVLSLVGGGFGAVGGRFGLRKRPRV